MSSSSVCGLSMYDLRQDVLAGAGEHAANRAHPHPQPLPICAERCVPIARIFETAKTERGARRGGE